MKRTLAILLAVAALSGCATGSETPEEAVERRQRLGAALMMFGNGMQQTSQQMQMTPPSHMYDDCTAFSLQ
jgi:hypothetical protein